MTRPCPYGDEMDCAACPQRDGCDQCEQVAYSSKPLLKVYIAHPLSGPPNEYLYNCGQMDVASVEVAAIGFAPFNPADDMRRGVAASILLGLRYNTADYQRVSMAWLEAADVVLVLATHRLDGTPSDGVAAEVARADELHIPVVYSTDELCRLRGSEP